MSRQKAADLAQELMDYCNDNEIPATLQMDLTQPNSMNPQLFLAACGEMSDYVAMTAEHIMAHAEEQAKTLDKPVDAIIGALMNALEMCIEVTKESENISTDIEDIKERLTVVDKDKLN